ncbi:antibiotic biosynthesis monooxygenase [Streptomyces sp. CB03238]|uniref:antibiotic biosynthesis monooxygenase n=1 Tax=Streptomyces sp. CB03238 TaxID=1907777 RepID=UPI001F4EA7DA|nr:antibiotic biosynthesis monooxygenase [Streptomyces sp. CB03238]
MTVIKVSTWRVGTPERQRAAVDAIAKTWAGREWPDVGPLSYSVYTGEDGDTLLHYSRWPSEEAYQEFFRSHRDDRNGEIDAAVPGIERVGLRSYELYRSGRLNPGDPRVPGCVVIVDVEFDGPDADRQRAWVDAVFEALETDPSPHPGGISAHFHVSLDGTRVLNYAEWESAEAHIEALAAPGDGVGAATPQWRKVRTYPGVVGSGVRRYTPALSLGAGVY